MINKHRGRPRLLKSAVAITATAALGLGLALVGVSSASAHTPAISGACTTGVVLKASAYDGKKENTWTVTLNGQTQSGTFGESLNKTFPLSQEGKTTTWSAKIAAFNGQYSTTNSGTLTCGDKPSQPEKVVTVVQHDGTPNCLARTVDVIEDTTTTPYVWDETSWSWVRGTPATTSKVVDTRTATDQECGPVTVVKPQIQDYLPGTTCPAEGETRTAAFVADNTGSNVDVTYTINDTEYVVKAGEARHIEGLPVADEGTHFTITAADQQWEFDAPAVDCPPVVVPPTVISVLPPQFHDICGTEGDEVQVPTEVEHVTYTTDDRRKDGVGIVEVTATADEGFVLNENGDTTQTWGHEFTNEPCDSGTTPPPTTEPTPPVTPTPTPPVVTPPTDNPTVPAVVVPSDKPTAPASVKVVKTAPKAEAAEAAATGTLAYTGSENLQIIGIAALIVVLAGIALLALRRRTSSAE